MRSKREILDKARNLIDGAKEEFVKQRVSRCFKNCCYNHFSIARGIGKFHYCKLKTRFLEDGTIEKLFVCNSDEWACKCEEFSCCNSKHDAEAEFVEIIANPSRCGQLFPRLSALLWVLNDGKHRDSNLSNVCQKQSSHRHEENEENNKKSRWILFVQFLRDLWRG